MEVQKSNGSFDDYDCDEDDGDPGGIDEGNMECEESEGDNERPLFNDVVLNGIMDFVSADDLPNCRLVCKIWADEAWRQLTRKKCISFQETSMKQFVDFMKIVQANDIHFSKLNFCHFSVTEYREDLTKYFKSAGHFVKEMTLNFMDKELTLEQLENIFLSSVPQLEFLALDRLPCDFFAQEAKLSGKTFLKKLTRLRLNTRCHYNNDEERSIIFFIDLLRLTPNLRHLHGAVDWCLPRLVSALSILKLPYLTNLVLKGCLDCPTAQNLAMPEFNLKTLYLGTSGIYDLGKNHNILYPKRNTLRALGLGWTSFMKRIDLETLSEDYKELTCLSLCDASKWSLCGSSYSGPGLRRLLADIRMENDFKYLEGRPGAFKKVRELNLSFMRYPAKNVGIVDRIDSLFPVLRLLTLKITHEFPISKLWRLTALEELSIFINCSSFKLPIIPILSEYLDHSITGLGEEECDKLRANPALLDETELQEEKSILNLKNLRKLEFHGGQQKLSHITAHLCLSKMKFLTAVTLNPTTDICRDFLKSTLTPGTYMDLTC